MYFLVQGMKNIPPGGPIIPTNNLVMNTMADTSAGGMIMGQVPLINNQITGSTIQLQQQQQQSSDHSSNNTMPLDPFGVL